MNKILDIDETIALMARKITAYLSIEQRIEPLMIGIHTGGHWVATRLHKLMKIKTPLAALNVAFYRDDFSRIGIHPQVTQNNIPVTIENRHIILVDDVLYTGRTIRAAMNEVFDYGRPATITLAVLVDRNRKELPIQANIVGKHLNLAQDEQVRLSGPKPLMLEIKKTNEGR